MRKPKFYDLIKFKIFLKKKTYTRLYNKSPIKKKLKGMRKILFTKPVIL